MNFGFPHKSQDIHDIMKTLHNYSRYGAVMGVFMEWHPIVFKLMTALASGKDVGMAHLIKFTKQTIADRGGTAANCKKAKISDMLSALLSRHENERGSFSLQDVHFYILPNVVAGAETTGISLSAAVYFLWKNPMTLATLREELDARNLERKAENVLVLKNLASCQYPQAVIKETLRVHPGNGPGLTRVIPEAGLILAGRYFPK